MSFFNNQKSIKKHHLIETNDIYCKCMKPFEMSGFISFFLQIVLEALLQLLQNTKQGL